jgi:DNA-binding transcriptional ArsR family regulator
MNAEMPGDLTLSRIAAAIGEPARIRILYCLLDGRARTSTELACVAEVSASTASVHLNRLKTEGLVKVLAQGKRRYYSLQGRPAGPSAGGVERAGGRRTHPLLELALKRKWVEQEVGCRALAVTGLGDEKCWRSWDCKSDQIAGSLA